MYNVLSEFQIPILRSIMRMSNLAHEHPDQLSKQEHQDLSYLLMFATELLEHDFSTKSLHLEKNQKNHFRRAEG